MLIKIKVIVWTAQMGIDKPGFFDTVTSIK